MALLLTQMPLSSALMHFPSIPAGAHSICSVPLGMLLSDQDPRARSFCSLHSGCLLPGPSPAVLPLQSVQHQALGTSQRAQQGFLIPLQTSCLCSGLCCPNPPFTALSSAVFAIFAQMQYPEIRLQIKVLLLN